MPRTLSPAWLQIYAAAPDLLGDCLLNPLLPCLFRATLRHQSHECPHVDLRNEGRVSSTRAANRTFTSPRSQTGSLDPRHATRPIGARLIWTAGRASCRCGQSRMFSNDRSSTLRTRCGGTEPLKPSNPSSRADTISAPSTGNDYSSRASFSQKQSTFDHLHSDVDQAINPSRKDINRRKTKLLSEEDELLLDLTAAEDSERELRNHSGIDTVGKLHLMNGTPLAAVVGNDDESTERSLKERMSCLKVVRALEEKLGKARHDLHLATRRGNQKRTATYWDEHLYREQKAIELMDRTEAQQTPHHRAAMELKKEDILGLVDLYFYSHRSRFLSESPDSSPTPLQLDDYSFRISEDFSQATNLESDSIQDEEGTPVSPLHHIEAELKSQKLDEIRVFQRFVDLLLDDYSALRDLFRAYKALPQPGVMYLSSGVVRLFLQRMSTPWRKSEAVMLRYLSLLDDMQHARLPITPWEWSSAIHLAGNSFSNVSNTDVAAAIRVWRLMEKEAGVAARDVTFNILFDIAVKAEKFVLAEEILKEMHDRGFRLNRLGRVALIYYYGRKRDGDGVRKAYRDFVEAGEIVDTLVLNCVMASLVNAQEPSAAEQTYERMKGMQERFRQGINANGEEALFIKYPPPGPDKIGAEAASNALGRVLLRASRLKVMLTEHHAELQDAMPLTPNAVTFRTLMTHHARTSGNIDRLTVLVDDMTRIFGLPVTQLTFQLLFMGFARHGGSARSDAKWTRQRLQITWSACLVCIKAGRSKSASSMGKNTELSLPSLQDAEALGSQDASRADEEASQAPKRAKPTAWDSFIKQFVSPYPQTQPFNAYPAALHSSESTPEASRDREEDYHLPEIGLTPQASSPEDTSGVSAIQPSKHLVTWIMRAFARCTTDRKIVEDIWYQLKRVWRPIGSEDKAVAVRELRRALAYCDTHGGR